MIRGGDDNKELWVMWADDDEGVRVISDGDDADGL